MKKQTGRAPIPALMSEYVSEDDLLAWAREFFLMAIMNVAPAPLYSLRDELLGLLEEPRFRPSSGSRP